jgi:hypothetical protein
MFNALFWGLIAGLLFGGSVGVIVFILVWLFT